MGQTVLELDQLCLSVHLREDSCKFAELVRLSDAEAFAVDASQFVMHGTLIFSGVKWVIRLKLVAKLNECLERFQCLLLVKRAELELS